MSGVTQDTLAAVKAAQAKPIHDAALQDVLGKSTFGQSGSPTSGLTFYDLEAGAKLLYPVLTPLRNEIPRVAARGGTQANWRAITAINTGSVRLGVSGGNRGGVIAVSTADYNAAYKGFGLESNVDFEAEYAAENFDDIRAVAVQNLLESTMIGEEVLILGGNSSLALGTTPTPSLTASVSGGALASGTLSVICAALSLEGYLYGSVAGGVQGQITRANPDGSSDTFGGGTAKLSGAATVSVTGPSGSVSATVAPVTGAVGYAWYWGMTGSEALGAITTINSVVIAGAATGTQTAASLGTGDNSRNSLVFDGLLTQVAANGASAYVRPLATGTPGTGTPLTADGAGGIVEIDAALQSFWDKWRLSPNAIFVSSQEALNISKKILANGGGGAQRFVFQKEQDMLGGGVMVRSYLNRFSMQGGSEIPIRIHPNMPPGTIYFHSSRLPYPLANVPNVVQMKMRREYYQIEWPRRTRKYEYGVYADGVLQHYAPFACGVITNIGNG